MRKSYLISPSGLDFKRRLQNAFSRHNPCRVPDPRHLEPRALFGHGEGEEAFEDVVDCEVGCAAHEEAEGTWVRGALGRQLADDFDEGVGLSRACQSQVCS